MEGTRVLEVLEVLVTMFQQELAQVLQKPVQVLKVLEVLVTKVLQAPLSTMWSSTV